MAQIDLIIFDCDGVLVDTETVGSKVLSRHLNRHGINVSPDQCLDIFIGLSAQNIQMLAEETGRKKLPESFAGDIQRDTLKELSKGVNPTQGVKEALGRIRCKVCVASSGLHEKISQSLNLSNLIEYFDPNIFSASQVEHGKPAPDLFLYAAGKMDARPSSTIVIEDSRAGIQAAVAAGMVPIGYTGGAHIRPGHAQRLSVEGAVAVFSDMRELPDFLNA